jgi:hypothetical protein
MLCWADFTIATRGYSFRKGQAFCDSIEIVLEEQRERIVDSSQALPFCKISPVTRSGCTPHSRAAGRFRDAA